MRDMEAPLRNGGFKIFPSNEARAGQRRSAIPPLAATVRRDKEADDCLELQHRGPAPPDEAAGPIDEF